jgi:dephospho-CoA kinase
MALIRVALTGGIATGKSYCLRRFAALGVPVIDADVLAREVLRPGTPGFAAVVRRFGSEVLIDGSLDRAALGRIVFRDADARAALEAIVHPPVYAAIEAWFARGADAPHAAFAIADIPLLYETGHDRDVDRVIVAACDRELQRSRLVARSGLSAAEADARLSAQWPIEEKRRRADYVIDTGGTTIETNAQVEQIAKGFGL